MIQKVMLENQKSSKSTFKINDFVVYPAHGVGKIIAKEVQNVVDKEIKVFVIEFSKEKMTLKVPVERAEIIGLRKLYSADQVEQVKEILKQDGQIDRTIWSRRAQTYADKINSGSLLLIAEVIRDLCHNVKNPDRSYSERMIYETALYRITSEFAAISGKSLEEAEEDVSSVISRNRLTDDDDNDGGLAAA